MLRSSPFGLLPVESRRHIPDHTTAFSRDITGIGVVQNPRHIRSQLPGCKHNGDHRTGAACFAGSVVQVPKKTPAVERRDSRGHYPVQLFCLTVRVIMEQIAAAISNTFLFLHNFDDSASSVQCS